MKLFIFTILFSASTAFGVSLKDADRYFQQREGNKESTKKALELYTEIANSGRKPVEHFIASTRAIKSIIYLARDLEQSEDVKKRLFLKCYRELVPLLSPRKLGYVSPSYHYFNSACRRYYLGQSNSTSTLGVYSEWARSQLALKDLPSSNRVEYGGKNRMAAELYSHPTTKIIPGGNYNLGAALLTINSAIRDPGGSLYCENYLIKMNLLERNDRKNDALELGYNSLETFQFLIELEEIPSEILPETRACLSKTVRKLEALES